ncbi:MAG TPA: NrfD/PsrC family molybdoenzyme membrane anchor subunit [Elusimicrobiota bacterium]|nr:NrfD/PsrC family molybdoenzyme membrane anchor subunit [Elusimicrobiota bacterium]
MSASSAPPPLMDPAFTADSVTEKITSVILTRKTPAFWFLGLAIGFALTMVLTVAIAWLFVKGIGIWGDNIPVAWGFAIVNFVWWIGIGHAGTLISAILFLLHQKWRTSINRFAEAMTLFAVACAGIFPAIHVGRPWRVYFIFPYPNTMGLWPQFRSPLVWDVFAVSTYGTVSLIFWFTGLIPDLASLRDKAKNRFAKVAYGLMAMGWRGSAKHWNHYETAYTLLAGLATPLVVSVHTVVSWDFAVSLIPGWHTTIFPPYFVAGAIYSGFAMVLTLCIPMRRLYKMEGLITDAHLDVMGQVMLATGMIVAYGYLMEIFLAWYNGNVYEQYMVMNRLGGPYAPAYWALILCNIVIPQVLWFRSVRANEWILFAISLIVNVGMWLERFIIVVTSLHRDFLPSSWGIYKPTIWDLGTFFGTIGLFVALIFLFLRILPAISISECREMIAHDNDEAHA